ncbi:MAG: DUF2705 family protein [Coprobacillus cateniformis]|uniref:DUF2705 family protein n=1 Tax=Longibaculum muris TaxID=1796628 RepID=UPI003AB433BB|nr:DUF2705 family protein [Coprobacillus cateniformis]
MKSKKQKITYFQFILYAIVLQLIILTISKLEIAEPFFLYGIPLSRSTAYHTILLGYWFIPVFFILLYFSGYVSEIDDYCNLLIMRYGRLKFYVCRIKRMMFDLMVVVFLQLLVAQLGYRIEFTVLLKSVIQYYIILLLLILIENLVELVFVQIKNINIFMNIFVLASVVLYNFSPMMRNGIFKLVNMLMILRIPTLTMLDICLLVILLVTNIGGMWIILKKKDLLGEIRND